MMLENISKMMRSEMPVASAAFYGAATLVAGRKFCVAAGYKACAAVANLIGKENAAEWNKASDESLLWAKKDAIRDLTAVVGFIGLLAVGLAATESLLKKEKTDLDNIKEQSVFFAGGVSLALTTALLFRRLGCGSLTYPQFSQRLTSF